MAIPNPLQYLQQVRSEVGKVTWPNRKEVVLTTVMVSAIAMLTALFFFVVDLLTRTALQFILGMFG